MNWLNPLFGIAIALSGQNAFAKNRLTDPVKIARECKNDVERLCKGLRRPAHRNLPQRKGDRIVARVLGRIQVNEVREAKVIYRFLAYQQSCLVRERGQWDRA